MNKKLKFFLWVLGTLLPIFFSWVLGFLKLPDDVYYLDYVDKGSLVLDTTEKLTSDIKVLVKDKDISKLSTYSFSFINETGKHFDKVKIEFNLTKGKETSLLSSSIEGPADFSVSSMRKIEERESLVVYEFDYIDRASDIDRNYFTISMLFSGPPPEKVTPISMMKGLKFRPQQDNPKDAIMAAIVIITVIFGYIGLIIFFSRVGDKTLKKKEDLFVQNMKEYLTKEKDMGEQEAQTSALKIIEIRGKSYKQRGFIANYIRRVANEP